MSGHHSYILMKSKKGKGVLSQKCQDLAGKTGTAEIKQSQSDTTGTELGWFTIMTTDEKQPILMTTVVEDVKNRGGSGYVVEHTKAPLDLYLSQVSD